MFTRYTALGLARFGPGAVLQLSAAQAAARAHVLDTLDAQAGHYRARAAVEFKRGETIGLAEQPARNMSETLVPVDAAAVVPAGRKAAPKPPPRDTAI